MAAAGWAIFSPDSRARLISALAGVPGPRLGESGPHSTCSSGRWATGLAAGPEVWQERHQSFVLVYNLTVDSARLEAVGGGWWVVAPTEDIFEAH
ncbi:unnamed protein product, partial [Protopolystoma xenopodis]